MWPRLVDWLRGMKPRQRILAFSGAVFAGVVSTFIYAWLTGDDPDENNRRIVIVSNRITNGRLMAEDPKPLRLATTPVNFCATAGSCVPGVELRSGDKVEALCQRAGPETTNGNLQDPSDESNPELATSTRWYQVRVKGKVGFTSEVWLRAEDRGGLGLPECP